MKKLTKKQIILLSILGAAVILFIVYAILSLTYKYPSDTFIEPKSLNPVIVSFGNIEIRWYAICVVGGASLLSVYGYKCFLKKTKMDSDTALTGVTFGLLSGILGARLYYVIFNPPVGLWDDGIFRGIINAINPAQGGLAIHGGIYATLIFVFVYSKIKHVKFLELIEIVLPVMMLAQVVGRWGNFFNQEAYGPAVLGFTGSLTDEQLIAQHEYLRHLLVPNFIVKNMYFMDLNAESSFFGTTGYFHPTFFYEGMANLIGAITFIELRKRVKKLYIGDAVCFYLVWYGIVRFFIELLRQDPLRFSFKVFGVYPRVAVVTSVAFVVVGVVLFILRRVFKYHLVSSKEFLYEGGSLWQDGYTTQGKPIEVEEIEEASDIETPVNEQEETEEVTNEEAPQEEEHNDEE